jgi:Domain of unknown function (DUF4326)
MEWGAGMSKPIRIQRKRTKGWRKPAGAVIVDRTSKWGNRFVVGETYLTANFGNANVRDKAHAVELFAERQARRMHDVAQLRGKNLVCWCPLDQPCHADVLLELANASASEI